MNEMGRLINQKDKLLSTLRIRGPSLPVQIAKAIGVSPLFASAFLSELKSEDKLKISNMRVGSSPLYYLQGQENMLENFSQYLNNREIVLICGLHRSGGTYLLDEISGIYDFPYQKYHCMHDDLPSFFSVLYWKVPNYYIHYIAEVAQFIVIVNRSLPLKVVVK